MPRSGTLEDSHLVRFQLRSDVKFAAIYCEVLTSQVAGLQPDRDHLAIGLTCAYGARMPAAWNGK
jgi:hypothetical protein